MRIRTGSYASTYSIIAADLKAGIMGGAVQSHYFNAGAAVLWAEPGTGVVATQAMVNLEYGPAGLELLRGGAAPETVVASLTGADEGSAYRQLAVLDSAGRAAAHTGINCIREAGHTTGGSEKTGYFSVQANMMLKNTVWDAMRETFASTSGPLWDRLHAALTAAEDEGGDIRGRQAAGMVIVSCNMETGPGRGRILDLRVEDHPEPLRELRRLMNIHSAYKHADSGDTALETGDREKAMREYGEAETLLPGSIELQYWHAVALANTGDFGKAAVLFRRIFRKDRRWEELTRRLPETGLVKFSLSDIGLQKES